MLTVLVIVVVGSAIVGGLGELSQWLFYNASRLQATYALWADWLDNHGIAVVGPLGELFSMSRLIALTHSLVTRLNSVAGFAVLAFIFVMLGLSEADDLERRLRSSPVQPQGELLLHIGREVGVKIRRFMIVRSIACIVTGLVVWVFALAAGLEIASAWAAIAFALNYIPFVGPLLATTFPTLFDRATHTSRTTCRQRKPRDYFMRRLADVRRRAIYGVELQ
ncbi:AI-2E family transporter [Mesorhizobium sp. CA7]|nr:AI-2E family transporter [Mesorhizobium sp. CA7]